MSAIEEIRPGVHWLGARHPELKMFDELFPTRRGTTYNAYLVRGTQKTALIDTVKAPFTEPYLEKVRSLIPLEKIDLVVINHTEPDHTGALEALLQLNPGITVCCTRPGENFLKELLHRPFNSRVISEGEEIDLGGRTLRFLPAPYLHWPDTMFTWLAEEGILFSCDAFGAHFCSEKLYDDEVEDFSAEFAFYFDTIMRPFKDKIREAVAKVEGLPIQLICPSHGPVLRRGAQEAVASYRRWAAPPAIPAAKRVLVLTLSPHGNTREMAVHVREGLEARGLEVIERSLSETSVAQLRDDLEQTGALLFGTPTVNRDAPPPVWQALGLLSSVTPGGKIGAAFGSYGWSGEAVKLVEERLKGLKYQLAAPGLFFRFRPTDADMEACRRFGEQIAKVILGEE